VDTGPAASMAGEKKKHTVTIRAAASRSKHVGIWGVHQKEANAGSKTKYMGSRMWSDCESWWVARVDEVEGRNKESATQNNQKFKKDRTACTPNKALATGEESQREAGL